MFIPATPAHNNPQPFFLAARLSFERKSSSRNQFSPPLPCCSTMEAMGNEKGNSYWEKELPPNFDRSRIEKFILACTREDWVAKNAKQPATKPVDKSVGSNNLVKDGARGSDAFYSGKSCSSSGKIPWGRV
ncbi:hypothetical protein ACFX19_016963 [Malus domestica]